MDQKLRNMEQVRSCQHFIFYESIVGCDCDEKIKRIDELQEQVAILQKRLDEIRSDERIADDLEFFGQIHWLDI